MQISTRQQAIEYLEAVNKMDTPPNTAEPCTHGHFGCALVDGGPCSNEIAAEFGFDDDTP